jgi:ABC-2 type transport system permease protein
MKSLSAALWAESKKIIKSKMFLATILAYSFIAIMMVFLLWVSKNPELAYKLGLLGAKARLLGKADWPNYFGILNMAASALGLIGFGFVNAWVFGREYSDRTAKDLLALPVSRSFIVLSKFIVAAIWCALLSIILFIFSLLVGGIINISGWSAALAFHNAYLYSIATLLTIILCTPVAFFASSGRGYLPPMGYVIITMALAQFAGALGFSQYVPWAIPMIFSGAAGAESTESLNFINYMILFLTSVLGLAGTFTWWRYADQT